MTSERRSADPARQGDGRVSIFRRVLTAQRLARSHAPDGDGNGRADADERLTERESAALAAAQQSAGDMSPTVEPDAAVLQAELLDLRRQLARIEELERFLTTAQRQVAALESEASEARAAESSVKAELDAAREIERVSLERATVLEKDLAAALTELTRVPAILEEAKRALSLDRDVEELRAALSESQAQCAAATSRVTATESLAAAAEARAKTAESRATKADARAAAAQAQIESVQAQLKAAETRASTADARAVSAEGRASTAEAAAARLDASRREMERLHAAELTKVRTQTETTTLDSGEVQRLSDEVESLRTRVAVAEEAVAAALRELGVKRGVGPVTAADVMRAVGPLTLFALGEGTPGWAPVAPDDTLAAAVLTLAQRAAEQQRRLDRLGSALEKAGARR